MTSTVPLLTSPALLRRDRVVHGFTTREGGVSTGSLASLNLRRRPGERDEALLENWRRVATTLHPGLSVDGVVQMSQVHGARVLRVDGPCGGPLAPIGEADGLVSTAAGVILSVGIADCVPVLLASPRGIAVAHAGWRGVAQGVVAATVAALGELTGDAPVDVTAAIGPHVSGDVYEVGDEVVDALLAAGLAAETFLRRRARPHVDLGAAVAEQLARAGVVAVDRIAGCTVRDLRFYSHRRDGERAGRMAGVIARLAA